MLRNIATVIRNPAHQFATTLVQNQYNFYIDFKGMVYFDDGTPFLFPNSIKDHKFITQLYKNIKKSTIKAQYSYEAQFWGERNFVRCAISPVIFTHLDPQSQVLQFSVGQSTPFHPDRLQLDAQGRVWHPYRDGLEGVFSNDLIAQCMEDVANGDGGHSYNYNGRRYHIKNRENHAQSK